MPKFEDIETPLLSLRQLGRHGPASARQFRRLLRAGSRSRSGWRCTATRTSREFYANYGQDLQKRFFDHFLKGEDNGWDEAAEGAAQRPPSGREVRAARRRANGRWRARSGPSSICIRTAGCADRSSPADAGHARLRDHGRRRDLLDAAADAETRDHRPGRGQAVRLVRHHRRRPVLVLRVFDPHGQGSRVPRLERPARAGRPRLAARLAPQARPE